MAAVVLPLQLVVAWAVLDLAGSASRRTAVLVALPVLAGTVATFKFQTDDAAVGVAAGLGAGFVLIAADAVFRARRRGVEPGSVRALAAAASPLLFAGLTGLAVPAADLHLTSVAVGAGVCAFASLLAARNPELGRAGPRWSRYRSRSPPSLCTPRLSSSHDFRGGARSAAMGCAFAARQTPQVAHQAGDHAARARGSVRGRRPDHRGIAESQIAKRIQSSQNLQSKPSVTIANFPFLTQLIGMKLDKVLVDARSLVRSNVRVTDLHVDLNGVAPSNGFKQADVDHLSGTALFSWTDLESAAATQGLKVTLAEGPDNTVRVTGNVPGVGKVTLQSKLSLASGNRLQLTASKIVSSSLGLIGQVPRQLDFPIDVGTLPMQLTLQMANMQTSPDGLRVYASADHVLVTGSGVSNG